MPPKLNNAEILALSLDAQAILAGHWTFGVKTSLTIQNQTSRLSPRANAAIAELVAAGIISDTKADDGYAESRTYQLTEYGSGLEFRKSLKWMGEHGRFQITEKITK